MVAAQGFSLDMSIRPLRDKLIVKQDPPRERTAGGLYLAGGAERELVDDYGTVVAVGPGIDDICAGDRVMFKRTPGSALDPDPREGESEFKDLLRLPYEQITAVIEP